MNIEELREFCLSKKVVEECFPFDEETLVFKVMGKVFLLSGINSKPVQFIVKCDPEKALVLREKYDFVKPGFHMNKKHWNTVICEKGVSAQLVKEWINHSYDLVSLGLNKAQREALQKMQ